MTEDERKMVVADVLEEIRQKSQSVDRLPTVESVEGIESLPAMRGAEVVSVPLGLLKDMTERLTDEDIAEVCGGSG